MKKPRKKRVFVGHPVGGDVTGNVKRILRICHLIHRGGKAIPVAPYLVALQYLDDSVKEDRQLGIEANFDCFHAHYIDELWLFGNRISSGMREEVLLAWKLGIIVRAKTAQTKKALKKMFAKARR